MRSGVYAMVSCPLTRHRMARDHLIGSRPNVSHGGVCGRTSPGGPRALDQPPRVEARMVAGDRADRRRARCVWVARDTSWLRPDLGRTHYAACIAAAAEKLTFESFRCAGHASQAYVTIAALAQRFAPSSTGPVLALNGLLLFIAAAGFHRLARLAFPNVDRFERALLTAAFMLQPAFLASVVQPGLDFPLVPAFVWCVVFAVERRRTWLVVSGLWLTFTKETGLLLYAVILGCHALWLSVQVASATWGSRGRSTPLAPLALPGVVFIAYLAYRKLTVPNAPPMWYGSTNEVPLSSSSWCRGLTFTRSTTRSSCSSELCLDPVGVTAFDAFVGTVRAAHREAPRPLRGANREIASLLVIIVLATAYAITRFTTYGHPRYFLSVYAVALFPFYAALLRFIYQATRGRACSRFMRCCWSCPRFVVLTHSRVACMAHSRLASTACFV